MKKTQDYWNNVIIYSTCKKELDLNIQYEKDKDKIKTSIALFNNFINAYIRKLSNEGLNITKEEFIEDLDELLYGKKDNDLVLKMNKNRI